MIFLDMDGVLCDFASAAFAAHGHKFDPATYPKGEYRIEDVLNITTNEFWLKIDEIGEDFWAELEPFDWTKELVRWLQCKDEVVIATSPSRSPSCYSGKRLWLQRHSLCHLPSMFGSKKYLLAKPGRTLVDDSFDNTNAWEREGGNAVLFPQPWNHADPVKHVVGHVLGKIK